MRLFLREDLGILSYTFVTKILEKKHKKYFRSVIFLPLAHYSISLIVEATRVYPKYSGLVPPSIPQL
jgi:hypothetical protein